MQPITIIRCFFIFAVVVRVCSAMPSRKKFGKNQAPKKAHQKASQKATKPLPFHENHFLPTNSTVDQEKMIKSDFSSLEFDTEYLASPSPLKRSEKLNESQIADEEFIVIDDSASNILLAPKAQVGNKAHEFELVDEDADFDNISFSSSTKSWNDSNTSNLNVAVCHENESSSQDQEVNALNPIFGFPNIQFENIPK